MKRRHSKLRRRYGRALPLFIPAAIAKLGAVEKAGLVIEPLVRWGGNGWRLVTGQKKRKVSR